MYLVNITELNPIQRGSGSSDHEQGRCDMVICSEQHRAAVEPRSDSSLPMTGEGIGLEALASPQAGYLGKVQERAASLEDCPWCNCKGLTFALRSYRINLKESITLCTNPQCLFPLVPRPLEDVLASLRPVEPTVGNKRKNTLAVEDVIESPLKRQRLSEHGNFRPQNVSYVPVSSLEHFSLNSVRNGHSGNPNTGSEMVNGYHKQSPDVKTAEWDDEDIHDRDDPAPPACSSSVGSSSDVLLASNGVEPLSFSPHLVYPDAAKQNNVPALNTCSRSNSSQVIYPHNIKTSSPLCNEPTTKESLKADVFTCRHISSFHSESRDSLDKLVSVPKQFLWRNSNNLCWLDSLLAVLVNCKSLRKLRPEHQPQCSSVWQLLRKHEDICAAVQEHQQTDKDGVPWVPNHVLQKAHVDLQNLRMSVFKLLQPKLHCKLGQRETPVFAMPLLLKLDSWVERLFQATFHWEFQCSACKVITKERVEKTLPTFTNIVPDWTPLNAAHSAPCIACCKKNERRTMLLESVPPVFALHFVEGLPHNNVRNYAFSFKWKRYSVTAVIQYSQQLKHFITWIHNEDGSWLEYDDLKHACETHQQLQIPAQEIHVVFWEEEEETLSSCSLSNVLLEPPSVDIEAVPSLKDLSSEELPTQTLDQSFLTSHNDTDIVCALSGDCGATADVNTSIGASTLLDTFEGLTHDDLITLTLVEFQPDLLKSEVQPVKETQQAEDQSSPVTTENVISSLPDSSVPAAGGNNDAQSGPSESESLDNLVSDPTFVPNAKKRRGRPPKLRKTVGRQKGKKAAFSKDPPPESSETPEPLEPPESVCPPQSDTAAVPEQTSSVSSINNSPLLLTQKDRWSYILSRHPANQSYKNISHPPPTQNGVISEVKPPHPVHSTPNPVKKPPVPARVPRHPLSTEERTGLPPKAAEMYGGFGAKNPNPVIPLPSSLPPAIPSNHVTAPVTWTSSPSPQLTEISSFKTPGSSKVSSGLSDTETLRYKLLKKLKAKKKKLAKLNQLLETRGGAHLRPDSTNLNSPSTVSSSICDGSDLLSPATTASSFSPDSTGFLEMLVGEQNGANQLDCVVSGVGAVTPTNYQTTQHEDHNFLEEFEFFSHFLS
ncbi:SUMO-specific isopeptidase USPL1 [Poeciliopsis prolifica]|uniref:SUMO-specific isopeptidase USPL1 n=1 Tax=Poeciliopsis prolifica TaxID=188132 RepID=UPI0024134A80|nr:SUMO-specific isopeptidase USPL1 [Poeciliopsis prolifica]